MNIDWLIVGVGLTGTTFAERIASQYGERVLIIDQRNHIAGNAWDEYNEYGILEHKYGPHIFHTNSSKVWNYLSNFTKWSPYYHKVLGSIEGKLVPLPFNLNSIDQLFPAEMAKRLTTKLVENYGFGSRVPILKLQEVEDSELKFLAEYVYENVFKEYTHKQWGLKPEELSPSVTARIPIIVSRDDRYFQDTYQAIPTQGYGAMVQRMLTHPKIYLMLNTRWQDVKEQVTFKRMVFTGAIDEFFEYKYGQLPYRSLQFDVKTHAIEKYQPAAVINYPNEYDFTRITEQKWLTGQVHTHSTTLTEYPLPHEVGKTIPYYPIPTEDNKKQYKLYEAEANHHNEKIIFAGRLADYMYYNMDQAIARALTLSRSFN